MGLYEQNDEFDMGDISTITIEIPRAFVLLCKKFGRDPGQVLTFFAGDVSRHPFITNGSNKRDFAQDYFLRANFNWDLSNEEADAFFDNLNSLRHRWRGKDHTAEYKELYSDELDKIEAEIV